MEQPVPRPRARHIPPARIERREDDDEQMFADLMNFIVQCLPTAMSVIITDSQYDRTTLLTSILERNQGMSFWMTLYVVLLIVTIFLWSSSFYT